ncbi:MAG: hypothetical protein ACUVQ2_05590 [Dissulfurimicrobium sp.]|uniref:hypothetical protein n=1 Tax=Dissulfurimicrobium sp. TaxID=2022436 RepID=UPI00404A70C5
MKRVGISPDVATCQSCRGELVDPKDRRYGYLFIKIVQTADLGTLSQKRYPMTGKGPQ